MKATTAAKLAAELGVAPFEVLAACRGAGIDVVGETTPLDAAEAARVRAVLADPASATEPASGTDPGPAPGGGGRRVAPPVALLLGLAAAALAVGGAAFAVAALDDDPGGGDRPRATAADAAADRPLPSSTTSTTAFEQAAGLAVGDCWDAADGDANTAPSGEFLLFDEVPCERAHHAEVFALVPYEGTQYPGDEALERYADEQCLFRFAQFTGIHFDRSALGMELSWPSASGWVRGDRTVTCSVYEESGIPLFGTGAGAGRKLDVDAPPREHQAQVVGAPTRRVQAQKTASSNRRGRRSGQAGMPAPKGWKSRRPRRSTFHPAACSRRLWPRTFVVHHCGGSSRCHSCAAGRNGRSSVSDRLTISKENKVPRHTDRTASRARAGSWRCRRMLPMKMKSKVPSQPGSRS